jgi:serine/threonine protein kinase
MTRARITCPCGYAWDHSSGDPIPEDIRQICPVCNPSVQGGTLTAGSVPPMALLAQQPPLGPGRTMGNFEILEEINRGGMGIIFKARQKGLNRLVALKVIMPGRVTNQDGLRRFKKEVEAAALLSHENIVRVFDTDLDGQWPYLAMEYVPGIDLLRLVRQAGPVAAADACYYIRQAAEGLQHAFEQGLIHRDIKPANLMVTPSPLAPPQRGQTGRLPKVKILDMGLARVVGKAETAEPHEPTQAGIFLGTPDYVSPEQAEDSRTADIRSDIYSLGGTFYYLLTGAVPFPGNSVVAKLRRQMTEEPPSAAALRPEVSADLDALVRRMMARNPAERPQTPAQVADALTVLMQAGLFATAASASSPGGLSLGGSGTHLNIPSGPLSVPTGPLSVPFGPPPPTIRVGPSAASTRGHEGGIHSVAVSPDGPTLLTGGLDGTIKLWNPVKLKELRTLANDLGSVEQLVIAPGGKWVAGCCVKLNVLDMGVQLWDLPNGKERPKLRGPADNIRSVAISPNGRRVAAGSADASVWVWTLDPPGTKPFCLLGHVGQVTGVAFSRQGDMLLSVGRDGTIRQWDLAKVRQKGVLDVRIGPLAALAFNEVSKRVAVAGRDLMVREPRGSFVRFDGHDGPVNCVAFSLDGRLVVSGGSDCTVRVWNAAEGSELARYAGHSKPVWTVAFGPAADVIFSGGEGGNLRRWPVAGGG